MQLEVRRWWGDLLLDVQWYGAAAARVDDPSGELLVLRAGDRWELPDVGPVGRETMQTCCPPYRLELQLVDPPPRLLPDGGRADRLDLRGIQAELFDAGLVLAMIVVVLLLVPWTAPPVLQILPPEAEEPEPERVVQLISARALQEMTLELDHTPPDARSGSLEESPGAAGESGRRNGSRRSVIRTPSPGVDVGSAGILGVAGSLLGGLDPDALAATARGAGTGPVGYGVAGGTGLGARGDGLYAGGSSAESLQAWGFSRCAGAPDSCAGAFGGKAVGGIGTVGGDPICLCDALDRTRIKEVIDRHMAAIRYCWQRSVQRGDTEPGKLVVKFEIAKDGTVAHAARDPASTLAEGEVSACVVGRFLRMRFPPDPRWGVVSVRYPLLFSL